MKNRFLKNRLWTLTLFMGWLMILPLFTSCDETDESASTPIKVTAVYLEDAESDVPDRLVTFARLGQLLRIEGSGFTGLKKIYVNGYSTYFNPVMVTENNVFVKLSLETPTIDAEPDFRNKIKLVKDATDYSFELEIRSSAPVITAISHTMPMPGEPIMISGTGLVEIKKITFPGNVVVTEGIVSDEEGEFCIVTMPEGVSEEGGSILLEGTNGGAYSPSYFNVKRGVLLDFDSRGTQGYWGWSETGSMLNASDLESAIIGDGVKSQGNYCAHRPARLASFPAAKNRNTEVWTAGNDVDNWRGQLASFIPPTTPVDQVAFQFDIYVPEQWTNTGFLKICLANQFNGGEWSGYATNYVPWIVNKAVVPFSTTGWVTVTIPFNKFYAFSATTTAFTFENVLAFREGASWQNFGMFFENSDFKLSNITGVTTDETEFVSSATSVKVYTDNWRVVPLEQPTYSDFPETVN